MTFYNVISGILFFGTCQAVVGLYGKNGFFYAVLLLMIMCNESVLTSEILEGEKNVPYTAWMKLIDLWSFFCLAYALVVVSPIKNTFGEGGPKIPGGDRPAAFSAALVLYWILSLIWNHLSGQDTGDRFGARKWFVNVVRGIGLPWLVMLLIYLFIRRSTSFADIWVIPGILFAVVMLLFIVIKLALIDRNFENPKVVKENQVCLYTKGEPKKEQQEVKVGV